MADLRDDKVVRASFLNQLLDLEGNDLKKVYEPISNQIGYVLCFFIFLMIAHFAWKRYKRWREEATPQSTPYKVIRPPSSMHTGEQPENEGVKKKRVCAVVGGTGFIGSHIVNELVRRGDYHVFVLGRRFRPERTNPDADCLIQVDMLDLDGLENALQGVDSVINAAAFIPNVFLRADEVYSKNRLVYSHLLRAIKKAKVQNLVHLSGIHMRNKPRDLVFAAFVNSFYKSEKEFAAANGEDGLNTCVIGPSNILGLNNPFLDPLLSGQMKYFPMSDKMPISFMPVEYLATALVNAENKLANPTTREEVAGKVLQFRGEPMSWKDLFSLQGWPHKISHAPSYIMYVLIKVNVICATLFQWAPFGPDLAPGVIEILDVVEEEMSEEEAQEAYNILEVGPPNPPIAEYIELLVKRYNERNDEKKKH